MLQAAVNRVLSDFVVPLMKSVLARGATGTTTLNAVRRQDAFTQYGKLANRLVSACFLAIIVYL